MQNFVKHLTRKYYKWKLPKSLRHMLPMYPEKLRLEANKKILWQGKLITTIRPLTELKALQQKKCFLIGTGPSVNDIDVSKIKDAAIWGTNGAIALPNINFDLYTIVAHDFVTAHLHLVRKVFNAGIPCLLSFQAIKEICTIEPELLKRSKIYLLQNLNHLYKVPAVSRAEFDKLAQQDPELVVHKDLGANNGRTGFSKNIEKGVFSGGTVIYYSIQVAYYMGFKQAYILGMDLGSTNSQPRFYHEAKPCISRLDKNYQTIIKPAFEVLHDICQEKDFKVYNLSPISRLPDSIIPKLGFAAALER